MGTIRDFKYKKIENFLTQEEVDLLKVYCVIKHRFNFDSFDKTNCNHDTHYYGDPLMESLMVKKKKLMEHHTGLPLLPTYSFWRMYTLFADLKKHTDRDSCEISVTVKIASDSIKWPIFIEGKPIELNQGDAVIYLGRELEHHREEFKGDWHAQAFLHYVDKNGPCAEWALDKRKLYGEGGR
jgi:hypothetical protein